MAPMPTGGAFVFENNAETGARGQFQVDPNVSAQSISRDQLAGRTMTHRAWPFSAIVKKSFAPSLGGAG
jgi:hypothetical protein